MRGKERAGQGRCTWLAELWQEEGALLVLRGHGGAQGWTAGRETGSGTKGRQGSYRMRTISCCRL